MTPSSARKQQRPLIAALESHPRADGWIRRQRAGTKARKTDSQPRWVDLIAGPRRHAALADCFEQP